MNKPAEWDNVQAYTGEIRMLPAGLYVCEIINAEEVTSKNGNRQLKITFDIKKGEYANHYAITFSIQSLNDANAKWKGIYYQNVDGKSLPFFKGMIENIEASNQGYKWNFDENTLKGKLFGGVFGREEFKTDNGTAWVTKLKSIRSVKGLESAVVPADKPLAVTKARSNSTEFFDSYFSEDDDFSEDNLPF